MIVALQQQQVQVVVVLHRHRPRVRYPPKQQHHLHQKKLWCQQQAQLRTARVMALQV